MEDVGLGATRFRTTARTVVTVPNGALSTTNVENLTGRDRILLRHTLSLRYETSADELRYLIVQIREMRCRHPRVDPEGARVRLVRCGSSSLDVEVFAYILTTVYTEFLSVQEDLLLRVTVARLRRAPDVPGTGSPSTPRPA